MRVYTVPISGTTSVDAFDVLELNPASNKPIVLLRLRLAQKSETPSDEKQMALSIVRGYTNSGNGSAVTPQSAVPGDAAASFTAEQFATSQANGSGNILMHDAMNIRQGYDMPFSPEESLESASRLVVQASGSSLGSVEWWGTAWVGELG